VTPKEDFTAATLTDNDALGAARPSHCRKIEEARRLSNARQVAVLLFFDPRAERRMIDIWPAWKGIEPGDSAGRHGYIRGDGTSPRARTSSRLCRAPVGALSKQLYDHDYAAVDPGIDEQFMLYRDPGQMDPARLRAHHHIGIGREMERSKKGSQATATPL